MNTQKFLASFLCVLISLSTLCQTAHAQDTEDARIARLIGLAKVWGTVKYFHPSLSYREIDWDKALVEAIPRVNAAKTAHDYEAAVNQMLAVLNDKSTHAEIDTPIKTSEDNTDTSRFVRVEDRILIIEAARIARTVGQDTSTLSGFV
ncbi:MAG TPA: hypothetical protein VFS77_03260, partial [Pyrinomonadaceae bacterium]|nr:hypothetical protein [Pyrinomonadaceae bacterium]